MFNVFFFNNDKNDNFHTKLAGLKIHERSLVSKYLIYRNMYIVCKNRLSIHVSNVRGENLNKVTLRVNLELPYHRINGTFEMIC